MLVCAWRLEEFGLRERRWPLLRDLHHGEVGVGAHPTARCVLLWRLGEVAAVRVLLLLLLQKKSLLVKEAWWSTLRGATLRHVMPLQWWKFLPLRRRRTIAHDMLLVQTGQRWTAWLRYMRLGYTLGLVKPEREVVVRTRLLRCWSRGAFSLQ